MINQHAAPHKTQIRIRCHRIRDHTTFDQFMFNEEDRMGEGGPWGWGGYTSRYVASLGEIRS